MTAQRERGSFKMSGVLATLFSPWYGLESFVAGVLSDLL